MNLYEQMKSSESILDKCRVVWDHYQSRKASAPFEPEWTHAGYELTYRTLMGENLQSDQQRLVQEILYTHALPDGSSVSAFPGKPNSPMRLIHDGWKAGSSSWIFMGRNMPNAVKDLGKGWIAVQRVLPQEFYKMLDSDAAPDSLWMAYNLENKLGLSTSTNNAIGPAIYFNQLVDAVQKL